MKKSWALSLVVSQLLFLILLPVSKRVFSYLHPIALGVIWLCLTAFVTIIVFLVRKERIGLSYGVLRGCMALYSLCLIVLLFFRPNSQEYTSINLVPFKTITHYFLDTVVPFVAFYNLVGNVGLFVPFGVYLLFRKREKGFSFIWLWVAPIITISGIETIQHFTHRGSMDIDDLILNVLGVGIGYMVYPVIRRVW
ncbi:VanZ family protein [Priestia filamentosa]|uniref:VanZ family protein n=1 Tax=Priestia filamentosa TaxID=1402861 RepID=UPI000589570F